MPKKKEDEPFDILGKLESGAKTTASIAKDVVGGVIEAPRQVLGGVTDAIQEVVFAADDLTSGISHALSDAGIPDTIQIFNEDGELDFDLLTRSEALKKTDKIGDILPDIDNPRTVTGGLVRGISQFLTGFIPASKGIQALGVTSKIGTATAAGGIADFTVFDPLEDRLSNLIESSDILKNPVTEYLSADADDSKAEGRFKNTIEGLALGGLTEVFLKAVKTIRLKKIASGEVKAKAKDLELANKLTESTKVKPKVEPEFIPFNKKTQIVEEGLNKAKAGENLADPEAAKNINTANLNTTDDVKNLIDKVAETDAKPINKARREEITLKETENLADELGMTVSDLLDRRRGQAFNAEQAVAARKILVSSGENLFKLAEVAKNGADEDLALFRRAFAQHQAIQKQVSGLTAEAGRALGSFRIEASSAKAQNRAIKEALEAGGGADFTKDLAAKMSDLKSSHEINKFVEGVSKATKPEMIYEAWINALLSSPATHVVNALSNSIVSGVAIGERKIAQLLGQARGSADSIALGEATAQFKGMIEGAKNGLKLAYGVIKTGDPTDPLQKIEAQKFKSITAENLNLTGSAGTAANFIGETVRLPGRFLSAGDELFKSIGYRMELNALAFRTASKEGLEGKAMTDRIQSILNDPPESIHIEAMDAGRYQTFTKQLGDAGQVVQKAREKLWGAKVIMPFIRTPTNIIKYVGERTPLAPLSKAVRAEFAAGGARKDLALAKIAMGSTLMAIGADMAMSGDITGKGPSNYQLAKMLRETGWQPYSVKVGDTYYSYSRLDPVGAFIGLSADMSEIIAHSEEQDALDVASASILATAQNVTSKTYLRGVAEFFDMMSSTSSEVGAANKKQKRWLTRLAGTVVPSGVASLERVISPELSATYGVIDQISSRTPGLSENLPPRRNVFGEPVVLQGGLGPDILSPIYTSKAKDDPVINEIVAQKAIINMPQKTIMGVELTPEQYDRFVVLSSGTDNQGVKKQSIKAKLREVFRSSLYKKATDGSDGSKQLIIKSVFNSYKQSATAQMLKEFPELKSGIVDSMEVKKFNLTGKK
ncbi:hypothetical protein [Pseudoalteromonas marina]|uniref:hypothetical protein n=1 Tax=Pseudoalteromonas marina TaxID=267375 RepID=UPI003C3214E1